MTSLTNQKLCTHAALGWKHHEASQKKVSSHLQNPSKLCLSGPIPVHGKMVISRRKLREGEGTGQRNVGVKKWVRMKTDRQTDSQKDRDKDRKTKAKTELQTRVKRYCFKGISQLPWSRSPP